MVAPYFRVLLLSGAEAQTDALHTEQPFLGSARSISLLCILQALLFLLHLFPLGPGRSALALPPPLCPFDCSPFWFCFVRHVPVWWVRLRMLRFRLGGALHRLYVVV